MREGQVGKLEKEAEEVGVKRQRPSCKNCYQGFWGAEDDYKKVQCQQKLDSATKIDPNPDAIKYLGGIRKAKKTSPWKKLKGICKYHKPQITYNIDYSTTEKIKGENENGESSN